LEPIDAFFGFVFISWALADISDYLEIRGWDHVKASVVHWRQSRRLGSPNVPPVVYETLVVRPDGSEEVLSTRPAVRSDLTYFAEMVYFVDGVPHAADLAFNEPVGDSYELRVNPSSPSIYYPGLPSNSAAVFHLLLGLFAVFVSL
jgi:hypothetical protein